MSLRRSFRSGTSLALPLALMLSACGGGGGGGVASIPPPPPTPVPTPTPAPVPAVDPLTLHISGDQYQGNPEFVVLVDGKIEGVWEHETRKDQTLVKVRMFAPPAKKVRSGLEAEAERLEGFLDTKVAVEFVDAA